MSEQVPTTDKDKFVPVEEVTKLKEENSKAVEKLQSDLEATKSKLLEDEYLEFLEARRTPKVKPPAPGTPTPAPEVAALQQTVQQLQQTIVQMAADQELVTTKARHDDFDKYSEAIFKILESSPTDLTFEQAYAIAKGQAPAPTEPAKPTKPVGGERPGGGIIPLPETLKKFKNHDEAANAAWEEVKQRHGLTADTI